LNRKNPGEIVVALAGQPNCGKSTIFNAAAGFRVNTGNFAGTTVSFTETRVHFEGQTFRLIDLPGTYSISSHDPAEKVARDFLLSGQADVVINVVDSSLLCRSLEFTLQLLEMKVPMVIALNMYDDAQKKGIEIDTRKLQELTGAEAYPVVAVRGIGIPELFRAVLKLTRGGFHPVPPVYDRDVEEDIQKLQENYPAALKKSLPIDPRFVIVRLLEMDKEFERKAEEIDPDFCRLAVETRRRSAELHNWPEENVFSSHRHAIVLNLFERVARVRPRSRLALAERLDRFLINPIGGFLGVLILFLLMFSVAFGLGNLLSGFLEGPLAAGGNVLREIFSGITLVIISGLYSGLVAGAGIVLPYLVPLLLIMVIFEDTGLLPRIAFIVDGILHRFGLHGKSVVPLMLGYGCSVPALMATRSLENPRDRIRTMLIIPFIACSARTVIILALAGKYLGPAVTSLIFIGNLAVALGIGFLLSRSGKEVDPGIIMDVPRLRIPPVRIILKKVWLRLYEFLAFAWIVIIISSLVLEFLSYMGIDRTVNGVLAPLTSGILRLPPEVGITLFLGIFRKELTLIMLAQALGTAEISSLLSPAQILVLVVFTVLYVPCIATLSTLWKEGGWKLAAGSALLNTGVAVVIAGAIAWTAALF
jgi:ferrous iron transport protein B